MRTLVWNDLSESERNHVLQRPARRDKADFHGRVAAILSDVKTRGDVAVRAFSATFDGFTGNDYRVTRSEIAAALEQTDDDLLAAMQIAIANIEVFHKAQMPRDVRVETMPGVICELHWRPLERVGFYVPGGTAPLFSSLLMQAIPARLAGCPQRILCTPPQRNGKVHPIVLAAACLCGIEDVYAIGGAQAIGAMAYGTATIARVDKISGPGNAFVTLAKQLVAQDPLGATIDLPAGPSEVMVVAGDPARPDWVAVDLLAQAEHGSDAQAVLVTTSRALAASVQTEIHARVAGLPCRTAAEADLDAFAIIIVPDKETAIGIVNRYAPEHLVLQDDDAEIWLPKIRHAGSIFLGKYSPETAGDYASGTNHVLPTAGFARAHGGLTVFSFMRSMTVQKIEREGLQRLGPALVAMAKAEGLQFHANAVSIRLDAA
ncbi:MAG TPA: histidinol dehydrogenase [Rhizomicrobium sp.]|jgi:histidinol dehydrogenase|nr:histidinol dehydrogenase [Rhizomicrobium sp.]